MCLTCRFMVMKNSTKKYSSKIGQKTGTSKMGKNVASMPNRKDLDEEYLQPHRLSSASKHGKCYGNATADFRVVIGYC